jgi:hypothetical protein
MCVADVPIYPYGFFKYNYYPDETHQLFYLSQESVERTNLIYNSNFYDVRDYLRERIGKKFGIWTPHKEKGSKY